MGGSRLSQVAHSGQEAGCMWEGSGCNHWRPPRISRRGACGGSLQLGGGCIVVVVVHWGWLLLFSSQDSMVHPSLVLAESTQPGQDCSILSLDLGPNCWEGPQNIMGLQPGHRVLRAPAPLLTPYAEGLGTLSSPRTHKPEKPLHRYPRASPSR